MFTSSSVAQARVDGLVKFKSGIVLNTNEYFPCRRKGREWHHRYMWNPYDSRRKKNSGQGQKRDTAMNKAGMFVTLDLYRIVVKTAAH